MGLNTEPKLTCITTIADYHYTTDGWLKSPHSSYEYAVISHRSNFDSMLRKCEEFGGDVAYAGLFENEETWE